MIVCVPVLVAVPVRAGVVDAETPPVREAVCVEVIVAVNVLVIEAVGATDIDDDGVKETLTLGEALGDTARDGEAEGDAAREAERLADADRDIVGDTVRLTAVLAETDGDGRTLGVGMGVREGETDGDREMSMQDRSFAKPATPFWPARPPPT